MKTVSPFLTRRFAAGRRSAISALMTIAMFTGAAQGQSVIVQLINGRNGKPMAKVRVYIVLGDPTQRQLLDLTTSRQGVVQFDTNGARTFQVRPVGEVTCGEQPVGAPNVDYSVEQILKNGVLTQNECGHSNAEPLRGRLLYFVRPASWWELFKN